MPSGDINRAIEDHRRDPVPHPRLYEKVKAYVDASIVAATGTAIGLSTITPLSVAPGIISDVGIGGRASREDHRHALVLPDTLSALSGMSGVGFVSRLPNGSFSTGSVRITDLTMSTARLLGRTTASTGAIEEIAAGAGLTFSALNLSVAYGATASTACVGNDTRLSDSRTPTAHVLDSASHTISGKTAGQLLLATAATTYAFTSLSGDATLSGTGVLTVASSAITLSKMANVATASILGRVTAATGVVESLTGTQATTLLNAFTSALKGLAPASGGGTTNFLRADGTWTAPVGSGGTVTSVALALPAELAVSGSPVTTSGTLTGAWATQTTNKVFAAPNGSTGVPTFRAIALADLPSLSGLYLPLTGGTITGTAVGAAVNLVRLANTDGTANAAVTLSFDPSNNGFGVRDAQIRGVNNGGNQVSLQFLTSNGAPPTVVGTWDNTGALRIGTDPGGSELLRAGGGGRFSGNVTLAPTSGDPIFFATRSTGEIAICAAVANTAYIGAQSNHNLSLVANNSPKVVITTAGNVIVGTDPGGSELWRVGGGSRFSGGVLSTSASVGMGYATGAGGVVTQITSRTTGVTLNTICGEITLVSAAGSAAWQSFTVTDSAMAATDAVDINQKSGTDLYQIMVTAKAAGSFKVSYATTGGTTTEQPVFGFSISKAVSS